MYALGLAALGQSGIHIRQIPHAHVTTITYTPIFVMLQWDRKYNLIVVHQITEDDLLMWEMKVVHIYDFS